MKIGQEWHGKDVIVVRHLVDGVMKETMMENHNLELFLEGIETFHNYEPVASPGIPLYYLRREAVDTVHHYCLRLWRGNMYLEHEVEGMLSGPWGHEMRFDTYHAALDGILHYKALPAHVMVALIKALMKDTPTWFMHRKELAENKA